MSDQFAPQPGPDVYERMRAMVDSELASYSAEDTTSVCFGKPEMAAKLRAETEGRFQAICAHQGVVAPPSKTAEDIAKARFESRWQAGLGEHQQGMIRQEIERLDALDPAALAHEVAELRKEFGDADYDQLVADARAAYPGGSMPNAALGSKFVLRNLQAAGRYAGAHSRARAAAGFK